MSEGTPPSIASSPFWHPYTSDSAPGPRELMVRASGSYVWTSQGHRLLDLTSSWWAVLHGHCHPALVGALSEQAARLDQVLCAPHIHPTALELCEKLLERSGPGFEKVFLSDNGSTAVEVALKLALQFWAQNGKPERRNFLVLDRGYHGDTLGAVMVSGAEDLHPYFDPDPTRALRAITPDCYRCPLQLTYPGCGVRCAESALDLLAKHRNEIAALIVEPLLMGAGGMVAYPKEYLERLVTACRENGVLVIFDEVFTGFGRTGTFFAHHAVQSKPDMVCLSKGLTSGMLPMGATVIGKGIFEGFQGGEQRKFFHGHTFTANGLGCAVALESLKIFDRDPVMEKVAAIASLFRRNIESLKSLSGVGDVRSCGAVLIVELKDTASLIPSFIPWKIATQLWQRGFWIRPLRNVLYFVPPYSTDLGELETAIEELGNAIVNAIGKEGQHA